MPSSFAAHARELETLLLRATRRGELDVWELVETYAALGRGTHAHLTDPRRVDLAAMVTALQALPAGILEAPRVYAVPELAAFAHEPVPSTTVPAGRLEDGTLVIEAGFGLASLIGLAAPLCALAHETLKGQRLVDEADPRTEGQDAADAHAVPEPPRALGAHLAFAIGVDERVLLRADEETGGVVSALLRGATTVPCVRLHAGLQPGETSARARAGAQQVLATLAEMGLADRPLYLWIGNGIITDCLSPYARELRQVLVAWARGNEARLGRDLLPLNDTPGEDALYALVHDFLRTDPALGRERAAADRSVGIMRHEVRGMPYELVDLGRIDAAVCDPRVAPLQVRSPAPVLVRLSIDLEDQAGAALEKLLEAVGRQVAGVTLALDGVALSGRAGSVVQPQLMVRWAGEEKLFIPDVTPLDTEELLGYAEASVDRGAVLSVANAAMVAPAHVGELAGTLGVTALDVGGAGLVTALQEARLRGTLHTDATISWVLVGSQAAETGRPDVATLSAYAAVAVASLRRTLAPPRAGEPSRRPGPRPPPGRSIRIKA